MTQLPGLKLSEERIFQLKHRVCTLNKHTDWSGPLLSALDDINTLSSAYRKLAAENERLRLAEAATSYGKLGEGPWPAAWAALEARAIRAEQALARAGIKTAP